MQKRVMFLSVTAMIFAPLAWAATVKIPDGTPVPLRLKAELSSSQAEIGQRVDFAVAHAVNVRGVVAIPEGSVAWGAVQSVKRDKEIKFDIQGLRLPNLREIKLRSVRQKTSNPGKDQIKLETQLGDTVGAAVGTEFTGYVDEEVEVEGVGASVGMPPSFAAAASRPGDAKPATQVPAQAVARRAESVPATPPPQTAPKPSTPAPTVTPASRPAASDSPAVSAVQTAQPTAPPSVAPTTPSAASAPQELIVAAGRVTVECFSDPSGAEIVLDDEYYGNTPSILKLLPTTRRLEFKMPGYKTYSQTLDLTQGGAFRTVRGLLEQKE